MKHSFLYLSILTTLVQSFSNAEYIHTTRRPHVKQTSYSPNRRKYINNNLNSNKYFTSPYPTIPYDPNVKEWRLTNTKKRYRNLTAAERYGRKPIRKNIFPKNVSTNLVLANVITFVGQVVNPRITSLGAKVSNVILQGKELHRLGTAMFLHGGLGHLAVNCYSLMNIGPQVESTFGKRRLLATYIASGISGNILSSTMSKSPSVGASGAIFGLISAYYVFLNRNSVFFGQTAENGMNSVRQTLLVNLVLGLSNPVVDNWGHLGGALGGAVMAYTFGPRLFVMSNAGSPYEWDGGRRKIVDKPVVSVPKFGQARNMVKRWVRKNNILRTRK